MSRIDHEIFQESGLEDGMELFAFESDFVATLRCIPMAVRFKLDLACQPPRGMCAKSVYAGRLKRPGCLTASRAPHFATAAPGT